MKTIELVRGLHVYHGGETQEALTLDVMNTRYYTATHGHSTGIGYYVTQDYDRAKTFGPQVVHYVVNEHVGQALSSQSQELTRVQLNRLIKATGYWDNFGEHYNTAKVRACQMLRENSSDVNIINELYQTTHQLDEIVNLLTQFGYTHTYEQLNDQDRVDGSFVIYQPHILTMIPKES